ncbi:spore germination protein [Cohnella zeiphila]|uniref:Spore germination protein n=1 Tax=Cohnella zeiphila TaxID=2761120 RepID=A0A7X0SVI8_9BACL|nr:spore germination protein [Cohnella zeiphila]MBB6734658.1 spore germination protein [Cohnella zeiphila]
MNRRGKSNASNDNRPPVQETDAFDLEPSQPISFDLDENERTFQDLFRHCSDIVFRDLEVQGRTKLLIMFTDGMVNSDILQSAVLKPLLYEGLPQGLGMIDSIAEMCGRELMSILQVKKSSDVFEIADLILRGHTAFLADGENEALLADVSSFETRSIEESTNEATLRGARESFTELLRTNTTLLRRIIVTPKLKLEAYRVGKLTNTEVVVAYIEGSVAEPVLKEVRDRVRRIRLEGVLESGYIEEAIEDTNYSPFPQMMSSERPDAVAAGLLEGKVAILTNGTPNALIVPMTFWDGLQAPDDYFERFMYVTLNRWIRYAFAIFSVLFPSIYIALTSFHPEMVPPKLMLSISALREKSPFPTVIEVFIMEFMFEGLREAGIRLPKQIGPLVSIVGALVIGQAAVQAGIISAPIVIVVSAAGISSFVIPRYRFGIPLRMLRFPLLILTGMFGLFGIALGLITILVHLIHLKPFGTAYLSPVTPIMFGRIKKVFVRFPHKRAMKANPIREGDSP